MLKTINWNKLDTKAQFDLLQRPTNKINDVLYEKTLSIIQEVKKGQDAALISLTEKFDQVVLEYIQVSDEELDQAYKQVTKEQQLCINTAIENITAYHSASMPSELNIETANGIQCKRMIRPIQSVGLYVPGGTAPLISTLMMLAIPASIVNCPSRIICSPPDSNGHINSILLYTAKLCGISTIFKVGGAQAIAAMAYGTESIPKVDKIFGPGNAWVAAAKQMVSQDPNGATIDLPAGPSEVLVIADQNANPEFVAADLLSQAEHGTDSQVILMTDSKRLTNEVINAIEYQLENLSRKSIAEKTLENSRIILVNNISEAIKISNQYAPEHLILQLANPENYIDQVVHAGAVFLGSWTPETMGDYVNGANHVLPTYGYAKTWSGLSVMDFMHYISVQEVTDKGLKQLGPIAMQLAEIEGLTAHKDAVAVRLDYLEKQDA